MGPTVSADPHCPSVHRRMAPERACGAGSARRSLPLVAETTAKGMGRRAYEHKSKKTQNTGGGGGWGDEAAGGAAGGGPASSCSYCARSDIVHGAFTVDPRVLVMPGSQAAPRPPFFKRRCVGRLLSFGGRTHQTGCPSSRRVGQSVPILEFGDALRHSAAHALRRRPWREAAPCPTTTSRWAPSRTSYQP